MRMRKDKQEAMLEAARLWVEAWDEANSCWCYRNAVTGEGRWEPPKQGYTKVRREKGGECGMRRGERKGGGWGWRERGRRGNACMARGVGRIIEC